MARAPFDLIDPQTHALVWRGWAKGDVDGIIGDQGLMEHRIDRAVARIFERVQRSGTSPNIQRR